MLPFSYISGMEYFEAIRRGEIDAVKQHLSEKPDLLNKRDSRGFPSLILASYNEQYKMTEYLLDTGADINVQIGRASCRERV